MKRFLVLLLITGTFQFWSCTQGGLQYPVTQKTDQIDTYFGTDVPDPYRWLEDDKKLWPG